MEPVHLDLDKEWNSILQCEARFQEIDKQTLMDLAVHGIPDKYRKDAWQLMSSSRELQRRSPQLYTQLLDQPIDANTAEEIARDLPRTFPERPQFQQEGGKGQLDIGRVLHAYAVYDSQVGFVQGMTFVVAVFLNYMPPEEAFWILVALMNNYSYRDVLATDFPLINALLVQMTDMLKALTPRLYAAMETNSIPMQCFSGWFVALLSNLLEWEMFTRVWDLFLLDSWSILLKFVVACLKANEESVLQMKGTSLLLRLHMKLLVQDHPIDILLRDALAIPFTFQEPPRMALNVAEIAFKMQTDGTLRVRDWVFAQCFSYKDALEWIIPNAALVNSEDDSNDKHSPIGRFNKAASSIPTTCPICARPIEESNTNTHTVNNSSCSTFSDSWENVSAMTASPTIQQPHKAEVLVRAEQIFKWLLKCNIIERVDQEYNRAVLDGLYRFSPLYRQRTMSGAKVVDLLMAEKLLREKEQQERELLQQQIHKFEKVLQGERMRISQQEMVLRKEEKRRKELEAREQLYTTSLKTQYDRQLSGKDDVIKSQESRIRELQQQLTDLQIQLEADVLKRAEQTHEIHTLHSTIRHERKQREQLQYELEQHIEKRAEEHWSHVQAKQQMQHSLKSKEKQLDELTDQNFELQRALAETLAESQARQHSQPIPISPRTAPNEYLAPPLSVSPMEFGQMNEARPPLLAQSAPISSLAPLGSPALVPPRGSMEM